MGCAQTNNPCWGYGLFSLGYLRCSPSINIWWRSQSVSSPSGRIVKRNNDLTIFAWDLPETHNHEFVGLFATLPSVFENCSDILSFHDIMSEFSITNIGLLASGDFTLQTALVNEGECDSQVWRYLLELCLTPDDEGKLKIMGVYLRKVGPRLFYRDGTLRLARFDFARFLSSTFLLIRFRRPGVLNIFAILLSTSPLTIFLYFGKQPRRHYGTLQTECFYYRNLTHRVTPWHLRCYFVAW